MFIIFFEEIFKMLTIVKHPLIEVKLDIMRDENTKAKEFREAL